MFYNIIILNFIWVIIFSFFLISLDFKFFSINSPNVNSYKLSILSFFSLLTSSSIIFKTIILISFSYSSILLSSLLRLLFDKLGVILFTLEISLFTISFLLSLYISSLLSDFLVKFFFLLFIVSYKFFDIIQQS